MAEIFLARRVDRGPVVDVGKEGLDIDDVFVPHAGRLENRLYVLVHPLRLPGRIAGADDVVPAIEGDLPGQEQEIAAQHAIGVVADRLARTRDTNLFFRGSHDILPDECMACTTAVRLTERCWL